MITKPLLREILFTCGKCGERLSLSYPIGCLTCDRQRILQTYPWYLRVVFWCWPWLFTAYHPRRPL